MRVLDNESHIRVSRAIGQYATPIGLIALAVGLFISFSHPDWLVLMMICLLVGFTASVVGGFFLDRYVGPLAHHTTLAAALKGLTNQYILLQYQKLPASHILLEPGGITIFVLKAQGGEISYQENGRWKHRQRGKFFRQFAGQETVGSPHAEAEYRVKKMRQWLTKQVGENDEQSIMDVPVRGVIVFTNPDVILNAEGAPVPALPARKLKAWLRGPGKLNPLPRPVYERLLHLLVPDDSYPSE
ncbi:MAG TPA: NERD domain-containing protein [Chloroflexi bacterium]|nr:NERD domain-containing protein [Chloroflexota bacterium]